MRSNLSDWKSDLLCEISQNWIQALIGIEIEWDVGLTKPMELSGGRRPRGTANRDSAKRNASGGVSTIHRRFRFSVILPLKLRSESHLESCTWISSESPTLNTPNRLHHDLTGWWFREWAKNRPCYQSNDGARGCRLSQRYHIKKSEFSRACRPSHRNQAM